MFTDRIIIPQTLSLQETYNNIINLYETVVIDFIICSDDEYKILAQKRSADRKFFPNLWEFTGGKLEKGESILECIIREMKEETNMELTEVLGLVHKFEWSSDPKTINLQYAVKAKGEFTAEEGKISEYRWIQKNELSLLLNGQNIENQIYKGAFYTFEFLEQKRINQPGFEENNFTKIFFDDLISKFYIYNNVDLISPKIKIEDLESEINFINELNTNTLIINSKTIKYVNLFHIAILILHDLYHNQKQGIKSYDDVVLIRNSFDNNSMLFFDIDADIEIYKFFANHYEFNLNKYIDTLKQGNKLFINTISKSTKVLRFFGSILSISHFENMKEKLVYLPNLDNEANKLFLISFSNGIKLDQPNIDYSEVKNFVNILQAPDKYSDQQYRDSIITFINKIIIKLQ